jgi:PAS domain-containing protein
LRSREEAVQDPGREIPVITFIAPLDESARNYVSPQIEEILKFSQKEWLEDLVLAPPAPSRGQGTLEQAVCTDSAEGTPFEEVYRFLTKDGRIGLGPRLGQDEQTKESYCFCKAWRSTSR